MAIYSRLSLPLFSLVLAVLTASSFAFEQDQRTATPAFVSIAGIELVLRPTANPGEVLVHRTGNEPVTLQLPEEVGLITELRACAWEASGIALAIEAETKKNRRSYFWVTVRVFPNQYPREEHRLLSAPATGLFLTTAKNYDIAGIINSEGDSIYIILSYHDRRLPTDNLEGFAYIHNCPRASGINGFLAQLDGSKLANDDL